MAMGVKLIIGILFVAAFGVFISNSQEGQHQYNVTFNVTGLRDNDGERLVDTASKFSSSKVQQNNVTWLKTIDDNTGLLFWYTFWRNWKAARRVEDTDALEFCGGADMDAGSLNYHVYKILTNFLAGGSDCPISPETFDVADTLDYTFNLDEQLPCGKMGLSMELGTERDWSKALVSLSATFNIDDDCSDS